MDGAFAVCGCIGSWLLVAGAVYQAALELADEEIDRQQIAQASSAVSRPKRISAWWWLLPPVAYALNVRRATRHRQRVMSALDAEQLQQTLSFFNKSGGWLIVATGAFLLAGVSTWQMVHDFAWPTATAWIIIVLAPVTCIGYTVRQMLRTNRLLARTHRADTGR